MLAYLCSSEWKNIRVLLDLFNSYLLQVSARTMAITYYSHFAIGLLIIKVITNNYSKIVQVFKNLEGDLGLN
jgi:hypothetical protein